MDLNEYIKKNYKAPNKEILKTLGASDELISYLMETPWNTNLEVVNAISSGGGGDDDGWTTIRLQKQALDGGAIFLSNSEADINNYRELLELQRNNQHPIINTIISIDSTVTNEVRGILQPATPGMEPYVMFPPDQEGLITYTAEQEGYPFWGIAYYKTFETTVDGYIDIKYKISPSYYTITWGTILSVDVETYVEPQTSIILPESFEGHYSDGTNTYSAGDTITFNSDMQLQPTT